ncbi:hypothetical protein [Roseinatronobacter alkalisoli]|uniref:Uncharacterized protein n=1 Tax=Roseinatronobacter alkalisoli TaxID=3028235 RepID=A0ABT5T7P2_9RHOB|nr:hypothetical protein [Roseinatronobacter sp. HJB301]MDD7970217.1 hypothetical protein [Roseinatronobacter sp. HJB301]
MSIPQTLHEIQLAALTLRGLLRGLEDRGLCNDPREKDITSAMINAAAPLAERLADYLYDLDDDLATLNAIQAEKELSEELSQTSKTEMS